MVYGSDTSLPLTHGDCNALYTSTDMENEYRRSI